jgi:predicted dehydrogenase
MELKFSLIGTGWIVEKVYLPFLKKFYPQSNIYLYDPNENRVKNLKKHNPGMVLTSSFEEACNRSTVVIICSPNKKHYQQVMYALQKNKKVICEKPLCISYEQSKDIQQQLSQANMLFVSRPFLFRKDIKQLTQIIEDKVLGDIYKVHIKWIRKNGVPNNTWFTTKEQSGGGVLTDLGSHVIDLLLCLIKRKMPDQYFADLRFIFSNDSSKSASWYLNQNSPEYKHLSVEDSALLCLKHKDILSTIELSWASHIPNDITTIEIYGRDGYIFLETIFGFSIDTHIKSSTFTINTSKISSKYCLENNRLSAYFDMLKCYINAMLGIEESRLSLDSIFDTITLINNIYYSEKCKK